jgi:steroid delta-isomerase-like uncharacterized protein
VPRDIRALVKRWTTEVWNLRREASIDEMMSPDCVLEVEGADGTLNRDQFRDYLRAFLNAVPDIFVEQKEITADGNKAGLTWRVTGTHLGAGLGIPPSGRKVDFSGMSYFEYRDGLIVRGFDRWNRGEFIASLMQVRMDELRAAVGLTGREAQVALLMADRLTAPEIAAQLRVAPATARRHCEHVLRKLGIGSRLEVAAAIGKIPATVLDRHGSDMTSTKPGA